MVHVREYLISVTAAAILCGVLKSLTGENKTAGGLIKLICGIFLALTLIRPIGEIHLKEFPASGRNILQEANASAEDGKEYAKRAMERHIKEQTEAYILDKARDLGAQITVDVTLSDGEPPVPVGCTISGSLTAYARAQLKHCLEEELGIQEENQRWISENK